MNHAYLIRRYFPTHTMGHLLATNQAGNILFSCCTLELPWLDNATGKSCIPEGIYPVRSRETPKFRQHYHVQEVPGREWILFHPGNYTYQLQGCILPGERFAMLDADAVPDILGTKATLNKMLSLLGKEFTLNVFSAPLQGGILPTATVTG